MAANEFSPLDQIRRVEAEVARRVVEARQEAEDQKADASKRCEAIKRTAQDESSRASEAHYQSLVSQAKTDAKKIREEAQQKIQKLRTQSHAAMDSVVQYGLGLVIGMEGDDI